MAHISPELLAKFEQMVKDSNEALQKVNAITASTINLEMLKKDAEAYKAKNQKKGWKYALDYGMSPDSVYASGLDVAITGSQAEADKMSMQPHMKAACEAVLADNPHMTVDSLKKLPTHQAWVAKIGGVAPGEHSTTLYTVYVADLIKYLGDNPQGQYPPNKLDWPYVNVEKDFPMQALKTSVVMTEEFLTSCAFSDDPVLCDLYKSVPMSHKASTKDVTKDGLVLLYIAYQALRKQLVMEGVLKDYE